MIDKRSHLSHPKYRADIDGLRAVAALSVVAFHAFPAWVRGGFIGVDIFFVISGYLISTIIFESLEKGTFGFLEFYSRRINRIFPALIFMLVACFVAGWLLLLADEFTQLGKHMAAGAGFVANFVFWSEAGYFDNSADTKPLLHLWSLGVEEQFYIVWPLIVWTAWKRNLNVLTLTLLVAGISFYLNVSGADSNATAKFYSPQTRFWELLCGSLLAWASLYWRHESTAFVNKLDVLLASILYRNISPCVGVATSNILSFSGFTLLLYGFFRINGAVAFPDVWAVIPVLGATSIIAAGPKAFFNRTLLSNRLSVAVGLISFPLYLWHWPLLSFARIVEGDVPSRNVRLAAVLLSFVLAWMTYRFVEKPIRSGGRSGFKTLLLVVFMALIAAGGYFAMVSKGFASRLPQKTVIRSGLYRCNEKALNGQICSFGNEISKKIIVAYGDSHVAHISAQLRAQLGDDYFIYYFYASSCFMGDNIRFTYTKKQDECQRKIAQLTTLKGLKPLAVITGQRWHGYKITAEDQIVDAINDRVNVFGIDPSKVIILGSTADIPFDCEKSKNRPISLIKNCNQSELAKKINKTFIEVTQKMDVPKRVSFVYPYQYLCPEDKCIVWRGSNMTYTDIHHLSFVGGEDVVRQIKSIIEN